MRLILREEVENLGKRGDIVEVAPGHGRNYLLPKRLAMEVTPDNLQRLEKEKKLYAVKTAKERASAEILAEQLNGLRLRFRRKVKAEAEDGNEIYGSVSTADVAEALAEKGYTLEKRKILLAEPFKSLGEFSVTIKVHPEVSAIFPVVVEKEEE